MSAFNGSGTFVISGVGLPYVTGTVISSTVVNQLNTDLATGLSNCLTKDGQTVPVANIPMGGFRLTGLGAPVAPGDALVWGQPATFGDPVRINGKLGINMVPVNVLDVTQSQNASSLIQITNADAGAAAIAYVRAFNGTNAAAMLVLGENYPAAGIYQPGWGLFQSSKGMSVYTGSVQPILFGINTVEKMRLDAAGNLGIGMVPTNILDMRRDADASIFAKISNQQPASASAFSGFSAGVQPSQGVGDTLMFQSSAFVVPDGVFIAGSGRIYQNGAGLSIVAGAGSAAVRVAAGQTAIGVILSASANAWAATSTAASKRDLQPLAIDPFAVIVGHGVYTGNYIEDPISFPLRPFLLYEDAVAHYPLGAVHQNGGEHVVFDDPITGNHSEFDTVEFSGIALELYVPLLMAAFQKQIALNTTLDARLTAGGL